MLSVWLRVFFVNLCETSYTAIPQRTPLRLRSEQAPKTQRFAMITVIFLLILSSYSLQAQEISHRKEILPFSYYQLRDGLKNAQVRFERDKQGRVAFLGGSITQNPGWRDSVCQYLVHRFPDTQFEFIAAGISSTGSTPGAFRLQRDVLSKGQIDLLFEEAAVNDATNGRSNTAQIRGMEGIVRHARMANPFMDIVLMHFVDPDKMADYRAGKTPQVIMNHERIARHYRLPSLDLAKEVTERIDAGEFSWEKDFKNLHPSPFGQGIYARSMIAMLEKAFETPLSAQPCLRPHRMPDGPLDPFSYENGSLLSISHARLEKGWKLNPNWQARPGERTRNRFVDVPMLVAETGGASLTLDFQGTAIGIFVIAGPDVGGLQYQIDTGPIRSLDQFTRWSHLLHLPWVYMLDAELEPGKHTLTLSTAHWHHPKSKGNACRIVNFVVNGSP